MDTAIQHAVEPVELTLRGRSARHLEAVISGRVVLDAMRVLFGEIRKAQHVYKD